MGAKVRLFLDQSLAAKAFDVVRQTPLVSTVNKSCKVANIYGTELSNIGHGGEF